MGFTITEEQLRQMRGSSRDRSAALFQKWYHGAVDYDKGRQIRGKYAQIILRNTLFRKRKD